MKMRELPGLRVTVDDVSQVPELAVPGEKPFRFVYSLTIHNDSKETVTIRARKWVVREENGETIAVEGDGVVGEFPRLEPGEFFSYQSAHVVALPALAEGSYFGTTDSGEMVLTRIPPFALIPLG